MTAPERIWVEPTGYREGWTGYPDQAVDGDIEYVRRDPAVLAMLPEIAVILSAVDAMDRNAADEFRITIGGELYEKLQAALRIIKGSSMSEALDKLIEAVEAGIGWYDWCQHEQALPDGCDEVARRAFHGSLDSAKAMFDRLLTGWIYDLTNGSAFVMPPDADPHADGAVQFYGESNEASRAFLIAILKGYRAKIGGLTK